jgi:2-oxoglutarate dehydrogenase E2 component (dihydrolipoamide succinyltransferase)
MSVEVKIPQLPESVSDALVSAWHKKPGDTVEQDENLVDIETDKVVLEVPAPQAGVLEAIVEPEGSTVTAGQLIAKITDGDASIHVIETEQAAVEKEPSLSPAVRKLIHEHDLDASRIPASGKQGRLLKEDVLNYLDAQQPRAEESKSEVAAAAAPTAAVKAVEPAPSRPEAVETPNLYEAPSAATERVDKRVPMTRLRARIAERLLEAQQNAAILTTFNEVNMKPVMDLRNRYKDQFEKAHDVRLGFMSFFVRAAAEAMKRFPVINASVDGADIVYHEYFDIGVAVSTPRGLVVPVLRNADQMSLADIEKSIRDFAVRAKEGKLEMEELTGGTFSITNGGVFGSMLSTPIINPPQSAILGMHNIVERPVAENGEVVIRPVMYLALSYDHRIVDGRDAVSCLLTIKQLLEDPARMLLEI